MTYRRLATLSVLAGAALVSGCAVYPYHGAPVAHGAPYGYYSQPAPVLAAPAPIYYGPAYPAIYPSISIHGRFGGHRHRHHGHGHGHRHGRH